MHKRDGFVRVMVLAAIFVAGFLVGLWLWSRISLPFSNPWGVVGTLTRLKFNPLNNQVRFLVLMLCPLLALFAAYLFSGKKGRRLLFGDRPDPVLPGRSATSHTKVLTVALVLLAVLVVVGHGKATGKGATPTLDTFHIGERLAPAVSYEAGQVPYRDFVFVHGVFCDALHALLAFKLFGRSIGAVYALRRLIEMVMFLLFFLFLVKVFRGRFVYVLAAVIGLMLLRDLEELDMPRFVRFDGRDICTYAFLLSVMGLERYLNDQADGGSGKFFALVFLTGFLPIASFAYSLDRGYFLTAAYVVLVPLLYFLHIRKGRHRRSFLPASVLGLFSAVLVLGVTLRWDFLAFFDFAFLKIPRYKELMDGLVFPISAVPAVAVLVLLAANAFWILLRFLQVLREHGSLIPALRYFSRTYLAEFSLLLVSLFFFRRGLGRADLTHIAYGGLPALILGLVIVLRNYLPRWLRQLHLEKVFAIVVVVATVFFVGVSLWRICSRDLIHRRLPVAVPDEHFIAEDYKAAVAFLRTNLGPNDAFYTMSSEGVWYYWLDKPSPTRFSVVWFAAPRFYQEEVVRDLSRSNVKIILYRNALWANAIDNISIMERCPIVADYLVENYVPYRRIDHHEFWIRKGQ